jgi:LPXTG-site transpeptidase (sortase) family protein
MHKIFAAITLAALAALLVTNNYKLQEEAQAATLPAPLAVSASTAFPTAPDAATTPAPASVTVSAKSAPAKTVTKAAASAPAKVQTAKKKPAKQAPTRISIPAIALSDKVVPMGVNSLGDLEVPSGSTSDIGWYAKGTVPGEMGSAVMDAHVFAALSRLDEVKKGDDIYVAMADGTTRHFITTGAKVYKLSELSPAELYSRDDGRYLHLITCAGELTPDHSTYTHRLVVYATLASD